MRSLADKRSFGNAGYGMPSKTNSRKHGAYFPKNSAGRRPRAGPSPPFDAYLIQRRVSTGNGSFITAAILPNCELVNASLNHRHDRSA
jgi:hypothetical protein